MVPAVTDVWCPQPTHCSNTTRTGQDFPPPQRGHRKPSGHRSRHRYSRHASSVANRASNSVKFRGYSSIPPHYILGLPESSTYPSSRILLCPFRRNRPIKVATTLLTEFSRPPLSKYAWNRTRFPANRTLCLTTS